jgi:Na+/H+-dicarboxylate symporter
MTFLKNYKQTLILVGSIIIGAIVGVIWGEGAKVLSPLGDIFLNLMFVVIVPLIFLTISTSISKINTPKRVGKILGTIVLVFVITSLVSVLIGLFATYPFKLVESADGEKILQELGSEEAQTEELSILERTVSALTVNDFSKILSRDNIIAIVVFAIMFGFAIRMAGEKANPTKELLESLCEVIMKFITIIMYYAPIGLGCYFASFIGTFGASIAIGYLKTFVIYTIACLICFFGVYTLYAFIAAGKEGVKRFWKYVIPATLTALATCSSAASIPVNLQSAKNIGVSDDIAETIIPLGTSFHKDGSIIGSVFKAMFLVCLFGTNVYTVGGVIEILFISLIATLLVTAIPIGGGTISETMIITMLGYPLTTVPILTTIATIIDAPATVLNVVGDSASSMLAARIIDGKDWMNKKDTPKIF